LFGNNTTGRLSLNHAMQEFIRFPGFERPRAFRVAAAITEKIRLQARPSLLSQQQPIVRRNTFTQPAQSQNSTGTRSEFASYP
jgi:hypothetical protein